MWVLPFLFSASIQAASAESVSWMPMAIQRDLGKIQNSPPSAPQESKADLYLCDPYCELVGRFYSRSDFRPTSASLYEEAKKRENFSFLRLFLGRVQINNRSIAKPNGPNSKLETYSATEGSAPGGTANISTGNSGARAGTGSSAESVGTHSLNAGGTVTAATGASGTYGGYTPPGGFGAETSSGSGSPNALPDRTPPPMSKYVDPRLWDQLHMPPAQAKNYEQEFPLYLGAHLDGQLGATSLSTSANTNTDSSAQIHGILGGGVTFDVENFTTFSQGDVSTSIDVSFLAAVGQKPATGSAQTWNTQIFRTLAHGLWQPRRSKWTFGLLLDGTLQSDATSTDTAILFSTTYIWGSLGLHFQYKKYYIQFFQSIVNSTQDIAQYRGTQLSSGKTSVEGSACFPLAGVVRSEFDACVVGSMSLINVRGSGTPVQPVFTTDPNHEYLTWRAGLQFRLIGFAI